MAVIVETGTIVASANSYASVGEADLYHENQGNLEWADFADEVKEAALQRGTLMLESRYRNRWIGYKTNNNQGVVQRLAWPRKSNDDQPENPGDPVDADPQPLRDGDNIPIDPNEIPLVVKQATYEAAYMLGLGNSLVPTVVGQDRYVESVKVDVISRSFKDNAPAVDRFPLIDQLLQTVANVGGENLTMVIGLTETEVDSINKTNATEDYLRDLEA